MEDGKLGKYEIAGILGKGAMGTVYDARDPVIDRRVAIKTLTLPDASDTEAQDELARFRREAQAAGRLTHPNIVGVFDYGETANLAYIVMEFVDGPSLKGLLEKSERFPPGETVRIMEALLGGLLFSHERGVVHRDIKPANVMLTRDGQVKIADFGIARIESSSMTQAGTIMGTPAYMSPEQFMGQTVDARTDIYSSGVLLYQMLTGEKPFEGSMTAIMHKVLNVAPPRPSELSVTAPEGLDAVVARAMAKRPEQRFASALEFARALRAAFEGQPVLAAAAESDATMVAPPPGRPSETAKSRVPQATPSGAASFGNATDPGSTAKRQQETKARPLVPLLAGVSLVLLTGAGGAWYWLAGTGGAPATSAGSPPAPPVASAPVVAGPIAAAPAVAPPAGTPPTGTPPAGTPPVSAPPVSAPPVAAAPVVTASPPPPAERPPAPAAPAPLPSAPIAAPTPAPTPAPVAPPPAAHAMVTPRLPSREQLRNAVAAATAAVPCTMLNGDVSEDGRVTLAGLSGRTAEAALRRIVGAAAEKAPLAWNVAAFDGPFCQAIDVLRPVAQRFGSQDRGMQLGLRTGPFKLHENDNLVPRLSMPTFAGYAQVTFLAGDGSLLHLYPSNEARQLDITTPDGRTQNLKVEAMDFRQFPANATVSLGDPATCQCGPGQVGWQVAPPYGVDMMLVTVSSSPLFAQKRPIDDTAEAYLRDLKLALDEAIRRGVRVAGHAVLVETGAR